MKRTFIYRIEEKYNGYKIEKYLKDVGEFSANLIKELKKTDDGILKNGIKAFTVHTLETNDLLTVNIDEEPSENIVPVKIDFEILYEDEDIMVVNKPPFVPTHPSMDNFDNSLANGIVYYFKERGEKIAFHAVNRLDKDTSGLMVIAKNPHSHALMSKLLHTGDFIRRYMCIVEGVAETKGTINAPIKRKNESAIERIVAPDGQIAITHYKKIKNSENASLLEVELETGRTHQIRVHMSYINHPLIGDFLYGTEDKNIGRHLLHSSYIEFLHPILKQRMSFRAELPEDMLKFFNY